ncbi:MAG TPA: ATP-binding protein [Candidatus Acidoferrales bacterium]|nr:ATP-binding protein [Candidatus Acidoferrales bacterium]
MSVPLRVLLIDDSEDDAALVLRELRHGGYEPTWERVDCAPALADALARQKWDLITCDYVMPSFSAPEALKLIHDRRIDVPVIIISGQVGEEVAVTAMKAGAHDYVSKHKLMRLCPAIERELHEAEVRRARRQAERRTAALLEVATDISGTLDLRELLSRVERRTAHVLPCDCVVTFYRDPASRMVRMISQYGLPAELVAAAQALVFRPREPFVGWLEGGKPLVLNDMHAQQWLSEDFCARFRIAALLAVPLRVGDDDLGGLAAVNSTPDHPFDQGQIDLCMGIARQLAVAVKAAETFHAQREEVQVSAALARIGRELIAALDAPGLLDRLCQVTTEALGCDSSHTLFWQAETDTFQPIAGYGATVEEQETARVMKVPRAMMAAMLDRLQHDDVTYAHAPPDILSEPDQERLGVGLTLCMALRRGADLIGIQVAMSRRRRKPFADTELRIARGIAQVASLALEHVRVVAELERADRLKSEFVATMSHELRTPINVIIGYTDLLIDGAFGALTPEQADPAQRVWHNARELHDLISATLDFSRLEAGRMPVEAVDVRLAQVIEQVKAETRELQSQTQLRFVWNVPADLPRVHTDPAKLKLVLKNLIRNAVKFTERGTVTLTAQPCDGGVEIAVSDTGIGIAPEIRPIIFEPFRQGDSSSTRRYGGVGLGLYIVRQLLDALGGGITVESEVDRGSTFRVRLPAAPTTP